MKLVAILTVVLTSLSILLSILALVSGLNNTLGNAAVITFDFSAKNREVTFALARFHIEQRDPNQIYLLRRVLPIFVSLHYLNVCTGDQTYDASGQAALSQDSVTCSSRGLGYAFSLNDYVAAEAHDRTLREYGDPQQWDQAKVRQFAEGQLHGMTNLGSEYSAQPLKAAGATLITGLALAILLLGAELAGLVGTGAGGAKGLKPVFLAILALLAAVMLTASAALLTSLVRTWEGRNSERGSIALASYRGLSQRNPPLLGLQWAAAVSAWLTLFVLLGAEAKAMVRRRNGVSQVEGKIEEEA